MKKLFFSIVAILITTISVMAQINPMEPIAVDKDVRMGKLPSGLTYYIRHNEKPKGQADFYILSDVGAIQEDDDQQGLAHFLEHMAFNGTKNFKGKEMIEYLEKIGVQFGSNLNANTGWDKTNYLIKDVPVTREGVIDSALLILHDWSSFIEPQPKEVDSERGVIKEELRTRDGASWRSTMELVKALGKDTRYEHRNLIGYLDFLSTFPYEALERFYHSWYRPDYQAVVIVGDIDVDQIENKIKALMSDLPMAAADAPQKEVIKVPENEEPIISIYTDPEMQGSSIGYFIKHEAAPKEYNNLVAYELMNTIKAYISMMQNARFQEIGMKPDAPFTSASMYIGSVGLIPSLETVIFDVNTKDGELNKGFEALAAEIEKMRRYGFTVGEFERAQADMMQYIEQKYNNRNDQPNGFYVQKYLSNFSSNTPIPDAETEFKLDSTLVKLLTVNEINAAVPQLIIPNNKVITVNAPQKDGITNPTEQDINNILAKVETMELKAYEDNVVKVPLIDPSVKLKGSAVKKSKTNETLGTTEWTLKNGITVVVRPSTLKADEVMLQATSDGGLSVLSDEDFNTGKFLGAILDNAGVSTFSAIDLQKQLSGKNASVGTSVNNYSHGFEGSSSVKDVETMLQLLYLKFTAPRYSEDDYNTFMNQLSAYAENLKSNPDNVFMETAYKTMFNNSLRRQVLSPEVIADIDFAKVPETFETLYPNANAFRFVIAGNVDMETLRPLVEKYIGSLPTSRAKLNDVNDVKHVEGQVVNDFNFVMQQPKVKVLYSITGEMDYSMKNIYTAEFLSAALDNRYLTSIREEKGGTYGVGVNLSISSHPEDKYMLIVQFDTNEKQADELCEIVVAELKAMAENGPTEEQMGKSREYLMKTFNNQTEQNSGWVSRINSFYNYGFDYTNKGEEIIKSITVDDVKEMMSKILEDENQVKVIMRPEYVK